MSTVNIKKDKIVANDLYHFLVLQVKGFYINILTLKIVELRFKWVEEFQFGNVIIMGFPAWLTSLFLLKQYKFNQGEQFLKTALSHSR